jgi:hypothetical protein
VRIAEGTEDGSGYLFPRRFQNEIEFHNGIELGWARANTDGSYAIHSLAPKAFFSRLIEVMNEAGNVPNIV